MKGAIIGDIIGSIYEFDNYKGNINDLKLFSKYNFFTDDTICSCGICQTIIKKENPSPIDYAKNLWQMCRKYPDVSYGANFNKWIMSNPPKPYNSFGNGAAMRISAIPYVYRHKKNFIEQLTNATIISHNHPEGIKGARVIGQIIAYCIDRKPKEYIKNFAEKQYCLSSIKQVNFNETCQETVPLCISILLDSNSFIEAMKKSVWVGGDTDTICAIVGSMAEPLFGIPGEIEKQMYYYLDDNIKNIIECFEKIKEE